jgi:glycosyltransferase involved in cell wall biosynthesis
VEETKATDCLTPNGGGMSLSVIVPVFNSANTLKILVEAIDRALVDFQKELILVNDGSKDNSWGAICGLSNERNWVSGINLMRNYGQHNALLCGIRAAHNEIIVTIDDDLQNPPDEVPKLLAKLSEGYDVVYGTPLKENHGLLRDVASRITKIALQNAMGAETAKNVSAFRVLEYSAFFGGSGRKPSSGGRSFRLHDEKTDNTCDEHAHWIQHVASTNRQHYRIYLNRVWSGDFVARHHPISHLRRSRSRVFFLGLDHFDLFWGTAICSRNFWRIPRPSAYSDYG